jgi:DNA transformation protein and related proteins
VSPDDIRELFSAFGSVEVRRLFGGVGIYAGGMMFGLVHDGVIYLKVDEESVTAFEREQLEPFSYSRRGERASLTSYRRMPDRLYDDPDELATWAREAIAVAQRSKAGKQRSSVGQARTGQRKAGKRRRP